MRATRTDDDGRILVLIVGMVVVLAMLVGVVVDAGRLYLARRSLDGVTDAAALAGAQSVDVGAVYAGTAGQDALPIDRGAARGAVERYLRAADAGAGFHDFRLVEVDVDATEVTVTTAATVRLPFVGRITHGRTEVTVRSTSTARNRLVGIADGGRQLSGRRGGE